MEPHTCNPDSEKAETNPGYSIKPWYKTKKGGVVQKIYRNSNANL